MKKRFAKKFAFLAMMLPLAIGLAWALQTPLTPVTPLGPYLTGAPGAGTLAITFAACDNSLGNSFAMSGREILLIQNSDSGAQTFTITSVADQYGRTQDLTAYSLAAGTFATFNFRGGTIGFRQTDGTVHLSCSAATIKFAVLTTSN